jgi:hypothetical protein
MYYTPFQILLGVERRFPLSCFYTEVAEAIGRWATDEKYYADDEMGVHMDWQYGRPNLTKALAA